jgi:hypothetical protein
LILLAAFVVIMVTGAIMLSLDLVEKIETEKTDEKPYKRTIH